MDSVQSVLTNIGAPVHFEIMHLSEVQHWNSQPIEEVTNNVRKNGVASSHRNHLLVLKSSPAVKCVFCCLHLYDKKICEF